MRLLRNPVQPCQDGRFVKSGLGQMVRVFGPEFWEPLVKFCPKRWRHLGPQEVVIDQADGRISLITRERRVRCQRAEKPLDVGEGDLSRVLAEGIRAESPDPSHIAVQRPGRMREVLLAVYQKRIVAHILIVNSLFEFFPCIIVKKWRDRCIYRS